VFYYDELSRLRRTDTRFFKNVGTIQTLLLGSANQGGLTGTPSEGAGYLRAAQGPAPPTAPEVEPKRADG